MRSQVVDCILQYLYGRQGSIKSRQSILKIRGKGNILERIKTGNIKLRGLDVAKGINFVDPIDCGLNRRIGSCYVVLNRGAQGVESICKERVYLVWKR